MVVLGGGKAGNLVDVGVLDLTAAKWAATAGAAIILSGAILQLAWLEQVCILVPTAVAWVIFCKLLFTIKLSVTANPAAGELLRWGSASR